MGLGTCPMNISAAHPRLFPGALGWSLPQSLAQEPFSCSEVIAQVFGVSLGDGTSAYASFVPHVQNSNWSWNHKGQPVSTLLRWKWETAPGVSRRVQGEDQSLQLSGGYWKPRQSKGRLPGSSNTPLPPPRWDELRVSSRRDDAPCLRFFFFYFLFFQFYLAANNSASQSILWSWARVGVMDRI